MAEAALEASGDDYNVYVPIENALMALGKDEVVRNLKPRRIQALESHLTHVPEDARARTHLAVAYISLERPDDAARELNLAMALRPNDAMVLYNSACVFCRMEKKPEALAALGRAWDAGYKDADWARRDPDLALLRDEPEFQRLYPEPAAGA